MVKHIVIWRMLEREPALLRENCRELEDKLHALKKSIPGIHYLETGINSDQAAEGNHDLVLITEFSDFDALQKYQLHPAHLELVNWLKGKRELRAAVDFEF